MHRTVPKKRDRSVRLANHPPIVVDRVRLAWTQVVHMPIGEKEGVLLSIGGVGPSDNLGISVDRHRYALRAAERSKVGYADPVVVEGMSRDDPNDLVMLVEAVADVHWGK